ncbi:MAG: cysteine synthase A [Bacillota bacterium]|nr:cysteine synthase A [Bacillota bacterium]HHU62443.1 cysteine synthase A [Natronincola sp.]
MRFIAAHETIGNTPLVRLNCLTGPSDAEVWVKLESANPGGSVKDRPVLYMINAAEEKGVLTQCSTIIEATSGNTGIAIAMLASSKGYKSVIVMPETMSVERRQLMQAYGAELILTEGSKGMSGAVDLAKKLVDEKGYFMPSQFTNIANVQAHYEGTGVEILKDLGESPNAFVAGVGTGGTITGVGRRLRENDENVLIVAAEPSKSPILSGGAPGPHGIQGIGANFVPEILDRSVIDRILTINDEDAFAISRRLAKEEGILCGISAGANVFAALQIAKELGQGKKVVTIIPDTGERYLSTALFNGV